MGEGRREERGKAHAPVSDKIWNDGKVSQGECREAEERRSEGGAESTVYSISVNTAKQLFLASMFFGKMAR